MTYSEAHPEQAPLQLLLAAVAGYLQQHEPWPGVAQLIGGAEVVRLGNGVLPTSTHLPLERFTGAFDEDAHAADAGGIALARVLRGVAAAAHQLSWRQNPNYADADFLARYAYCELVGLAGHAYCSSLSAGLLYLAAETFYAPHAHPAEEAYHLLSGDSRWQQGDAPACWLAPGARVLHPSGVAHSMHSGAQPMLALYLWRGDLGSAARLT